MSRTMEMTVSQPAELAPVEVTPMGLIEMATRQGASIEQMQQLFDLQLRWEANEAQKAFNAAFSSFKSEAVRIVKNTDIKAGPLAGSKYANLFGVVNSVTPALSRHGLSHSWKLTKDEPKWMEVTCTIKHELGHSESVSMGAEPDSGPGRNAIQARGSAKTYLERYTLLAAIGMAASDTDNDGRGAGPMMPEPEYVRLRDSIDAATNRDELEKVYRSAYKAAQQSGDKQAMQSFIDAKDARKKGLAA